MSHEANKTKGGERMKKATAIRLVTALAGSALALCFSLPVQAQGTGEKTYKAKCASCHAPDGSGSTPAGKAMKARDFCSDEVKKETDAEWTDIIVKGKNKMPAYKALSSGEVKDVIAYIRGLCKK
jgi:mono/diheme cytochrome c family protein